MPRRYTIPFDATMGCVQCQFVRTRTDEKWDKDGWHQIHYAVKMGNIKALHAQIDQGASVELPTKCEYMATPMRVACLWDKPQAARWLLEHKANVNGLNIHGHSLLMEAADFYDGQLDMVRLLLEWKADASLRSPAGRTALDYAKGPRLLTSYDDDRNNATLSRCRIVIKLLEDVEKIAAAPRAPPAPSPLT